jgi:hypothetical protein
MTGRLAILASGAVLALGLCGPSFAQTTSYDSLTQQKLQGPDRQGESGTISQDYTIANTSGDLVFTDFHLHEAGGGNTNILGVTGVNVGPVTISGNGAFADWNWLTPIKPGQSAVITVAYDKPIVHSALNTFGTPTGYSTPEPTSAAMLLPMLAPLGLLLRRRRS